MFLNIFIKKLIDVIIDKYDDQAIFGTEIRKLMKDISR